MLMTNNTTNERGMLLRFSHTDLGLAAKQTKYAQLQQYHKYKYCPHVVHFTSVNADIQHCTTKHMASATFYQADFARSSCRKQRAISQVQRFSTILCQYAPIHVNTKINHAAHSYYFTCYFCYMYQIFTLIFQKR